MIAPIQARPAAVALHVARTNKAAHRRSAVGHETIRDPGLAFEDHPDRGETAWLDSDTVIINSGPYCLSQASQPGPSKAHLLHVRNRRRLGQVRSHRGPIKASATWTSSSALEGSRDGQAEACAGVAFKRRGADYRASAPLQDLALLRDDPAKTMRAATVKYRTALRDIRQWQQDVEALRRSKTALPAKKAWELGNIVHKLDEELAKHGCQLEDPYGTWSDTRIVA